MKLLDDRKSVEKTIASKVVTYDFARLMEGATEVKCSEFGDELIKNLISFTSRYIDGKHALGHYG